MKKVQLKLKLKQTRMKRRTDKTLGISITMQMTLFVEHLQVECIYFQLHYFHQNTLYYANHPRSSLYSTIEKNDIIHKGKLKQILIVK